MSSILTIYFMINIAITTILFMSAKPMMEELGYEDVHYYAFLLIYTSLSIPILIYGVLIQCQPVPDLKTALQRFKDAVDIFLKRK